MLYKSYKGLDRFEIGTQRKSIEISVEVDQQLQTTVLWLLLLLVKPAGLVVFHTVEDGH